MPRSTPTDAELALLPGYEADPKGRGYYFNSPTGRCFMKGAMPGDECHWHERWGMVNISKCVDAILREKGPPQRVPINDRLMQNFAAYDFDQSIVNNMSEARRDTPVILVIGADGAHVIDGAHRLRRRVRDRCTHVDIFLMKSDILQAMRVQLMRQQPDGSWKEDGGVSDEALAQEIAAGKKLAKTIVRPRK